MSDPVSQHPFPAYIGSDPYVFVSYSHRDKTLVYPLIARLHQKGCRIWYDEGIEASSRWTQAIAEKLAGSAQFLIFLSRNASQSQHVNDELDFARHKKKELLIVYLEEFERSDDLQLRIGSVQALISEPQSERFWEKLTRAIHANVWSSENSESKPASSSISPTDLVWSRHYPRVVRMLKLLEQHRFSALRKVVLNRLEDTFHWPRERAQLADFVLGELVNNSFEHGCAGDGSKEVRLELEIKDNFLEITVQDEGQGFDLASVLERKGTPRDLRGRGLKLIYNACLSLVAADCGRTVRAVVEKMPWAVTRYFEEQNVTLIPLPESLDYTTVERLNEIISRILKKNHYRIVLDCEACRHCSSTGLGFFLNLSSECDEKGGKLVLFGVGAPISNVLEMLGIDVLSTAPDLPSALALFEK
ncbi:MAG TPA: TIR domain-containing protein [Planctomycetota bacterium]|nr:TIR domain-containing protein [Planctomycetota bacterium]